MLRSPRRSFVAARHRSPRNRHVFGSAAGMPSSLVSPQETPDQSFRLLLTTGSERSDELSERGVVQVALVSQDGRAHLCQLVENDFRGNAGSTEEIQLALPRLGELASLWISPLSGSWRVNAAKLVSLADGSVQHFTLSDDGSGELRRSAAPVQRSEREVETAREASLASYDSLKLRLVGATALLSLVGCLPAGLLGGREALLPFLVGCVAGILYLLLLENGVDRLQPAGTDEAGEARSASGTGAVPRLAAVGLLLLGGFKAASELAGGDEKKLQVYLLSGVSGFLVYKAGLLLVGLQGSREGGD